MSNIELVLLKRDWRTPMGRFRRSLDGIPTEIPKKVLRRHKLPSGAQLVGPDYVVPSQRDEDHESIELTAAKQEAEVNRRVNEELDRRERERLQALREKSAEGSREDAPTPAPFDNSILDGSIQEITKLLDGKSREELEYLLEMEDGGKTRKGVIVALEAALEDLGG